MMEQQNRVILISAVISVVLGFVAGFLGSRWGAPTTGKPELGVIQAQRFQITDSNGRSRGRFEVDSQGVARLELTGTDGASLVSLSANPQGSTSMQMGDAKGQKSLVLNTDPQGSKMIALYYEGVPQLALEVQKNGEPVINLNHKGKQVINLGLTGQDDPHIAFYGENQKVALEMLSKKNGDRSLTLSGKDGIPRIVLGLKIDQKAALGLFDRKGKTRVALMDEPALFLLKDGKLIRSLP